MPFNTKKFQKTKFEVRTEEVPVPDMADFFDQGEKPVWKIKGLTGKEYGRVKEAAAKNNNVAAILEAIASGSNKKKVSGLKKALGVDEVPQDIAERIEILTVGSVEPACDTELALLICERYPVDFFNITNRCLALTGKGMEPGKPKDSGTPPESKTV